MRESAALRSAQASAIRAANPVDEEQATCPSKPNPLSSSPMGFGPMDHVIVRSFRVSWPMVSRSYRRKTISTQSPTTRPQCGRRSPALTALLFSLAILWRHCHYSGRYRQAGRSTRLHLRLRPGGGCHNVCRSKQISSDAHLPASRSCGRADLATSDRRAGIRRRLAGGGAATCLVDPDGTFG